MRTINFKIGLRFFMTGLLALALPLVHVAQNETIISLNAQLESATTDSSTVDILNKLSLKYLDLNQMEKGYKAAHKASTLANTIEYLCGQGIALQNIGLHCNYTNQFSLAIDYFNSSLKVFQQLHDSAQMANQLNNIGTVYQNLTVYDTALQYFNHSREILVHNRNSAVLANTCIMIGLVCNTKGKYEEALENFMESMHLFQSCEDELGMSLAYCYIGMIYRQLGDFGRATEYLNIALELNKRYGPTRDIVEVYLQFGILYQVDDRHQDAILMIKKSLKRARYYNNLRKVAECLNNIGAVYHDMGDYQAALSFYKRALTIRNELGINHGIVQTSTNIARAYLNMAEAQKSGQSNDSSVPIGSEQEIFLLLKRSKRMASESGDFQDLVWTYETLILAFSTFDKYQGAVRYQNELIRFKDSVASINRKKSIAELQASFERDQKEQEIVLLISEKKVQETKMKRQKLERYFYMGGGVSLIFLIIGLFNRLNFVNRTRNELQLKSTQIEEEKRRAQQSENVKEQFLAKMSHEIRVPMNTIMGSVNIILNEKHLQSQKKYLNAIYKSSENLLVIIDDILDLTNLEAGNIKLEKAPFNVRKEIKNVEQILLFRAKEKGIRLVAVISENIPECVLGDATKLNQILINLVGNGIKFTKNGSVIISADVKEKREKDLTLKFEVEDTGIGIPKERLGKIFRSFTQADSDTTRKYGGTGLGLTISRQLLKLQNGYISVSSEPGTGSTFSFEIPYEIGSAESIGLEKSGHPEKDNMKDLRILVVEDDEFNVMAVKDTLETALEGAVLEVAENGKEALQKWSNGQYDVILMDIELPEMSGHQVTQSIRKSRKPNANVPIIAMTTNAMQKDVEACFSSGMNDYVAKPFDPEDLILKINSILMNQKKPNP